MGWEWRLWGSCCSLPGLLFEWRRVADMFAFSCSLTTTRQTTSPIKHTQSPLSFFLKIHPKLSNEVVPSATTSTSTSHPPASSNNTLVKCGCRKLTIKNTPSSFNTLQTSLRYFPVFSLTTLGGSHGDPWIMASRVDLSKATSMEQEVREGMSRMSAYCQVIVVLGGVGRWDMRSTTLCEKSRQSWDL